MRTTPPATIAKMHTMREAGKTIGQISRVCKVARGTVMRHLGPCHRLKQPAFEIDPPDTSRTIWCDRCKANVHPECVACQLRRILAAKGKR